MLTMIIQKNKSVELGYELKYFSSMGINGNRTWTQPSLFFMQDLVGDGG